MSINAVNSVSLYEYYYRINDEKKDDKDNSVAKELEKYGITPTDDDATNIALLERAKNKEKNDIAEASLKNQNTVRPWQDLMYQLNLAENENPKDDIQDIKDELSLLIQGVEDKELEAEISDLKEYVENLYVTYVNNSGATDIAGVLDSQLYNLSLLNQAKFF